MRSSTDMPSGRQRLKNCAKLIEHHLSDLHLIFDKDLLRMLGHDGAQYVTLNYLQDAIPDLQELTLAQLRRAIKYDAKDLLELHPELDTVRRRRPFSETEAVGRMLFVDDIDIAGYEDDPTNIFEQLLLPYPSVTTGLISDIPENGDDKDDTDDSQLADHDDAIDFQLLNQRTVIRPYGYKPTRFFQGFCYVEFATNELASQMSSKILARNNSVRVMPM
ncbi:hypothetical protein BGX20_001375 [Mortierella sp. AD010]|nr:hypothetical protein BGX20_001375 [Mortierella sp. AD010]